MKYRKQEAKEYAKTVLHGVWTALPTTFTQDDRIDEAGNAANLEHCIAKLQLAGHYCIGNVGEFWSMTNEERMRVAEINVEVAKGRIPLIAGCHHQNPYEAVKLAQHAQAIGVDFVIILTPYVAARGDDAVYDYYRFVAERVDIGIVLFNTEATYPISPRLAKRLATIPNICGFKQGVSKVQPTIALREAIGREMEVSVADEAPWLYNLSVMGDRWLLNYCPHLFQVPGYLPVNDYTRAALAGDMNAATEICRSLNPLRAVLAKWIPGYGSAGGRMAIAEQKYWMELIGMAGGPVRTPCAGMTEDAKRTMRADLEATGLVARAASAGKAGAADRRAA
ncbi:MAG: dihydrodipicolinate synthase family protein [Betaproteobacteria bacterium]|nr:dihydrodipicolinate synthase family protein [Betaproteobacteria bacterium]